MQQENKDLQRKLLMAQQLIDVLKQRVEILQYSVELNREVLGYYLPHLQVGLDWKRIYLPVSGKIKSPPFSKN